MKRGRGGSSSRRPWFARGGASHFNDQRDKPLFTVNRTANNRFGATNSDSDEDDNRRQPQRQNFEPAPTDMSFSTEREHGEYVGWKLYFPEKSEYVVYIKTQCSIHLLLGFKQSADIVRRVKAAENHFRSFGHWYNTADIEQSFLVDLNLQNIMEDKELGNDWSEFEEELRFKSTQTLACVALAMHNIIVQEQSQEKNDFCYKKIYVR